MEDYIQLLVFAAFALFSLISGLLNRNKDKPPRRIPPEEVERNRERERTARGKPVARQRRRQTQPQSTSTLDEILRELTEQEQQPTREELAQEEERRLEEERAWVREKKKKMADHLEEASDTLKTAARQARKSPRMADKISLEDDHKRIQPLVVTPKRTSTKKKNTGAIIARSLRNQSTAKRAIILSEILQRKHF